MLYYTKEHYANELCTRIENGILTNGGRCFSFTLEITTYVRSFERHETVFFPKMWKQKSVDHTGNLSAFKKALRMLPSSITAEYQYKDFGDSRPTSKTSWASIAEGYIVTVNVSEAYASEWYKKHVAAGLPFRDKLLSEHKELVKKIAGYNDSCQYVKKELKYEGSIARFYVTPTGVGESYSLDVESHGNYFAHYGMRNLNDMSECYGFALAIIEIYRPVWEQYGALDIKMKHGGESICVEVEAIRGKPTFKPW